jgi:phosphoribosylformylglycinamidine synthase
VAERAADALVPFAEIGVTGGDTLTLGGDAIAVAILKAAHEGWLPAYMAGAN